MTALRSRNGRRPPQGRLAPQEPAAVVPFPASQNRPKVDSIAAYVLSLKPGHGEAQLAFRIRQTAESLIDRGVDEATAWASASEYESAIRGAMWRQVFEGPRNGGGDDCA